MLFDILTGQRATQAGVAEVIPYLGRHGDTAGVLPGGGRLIGSHERRGYGDGQVVYLVRDARSVVLSQYSRMRRRGYTAEDLESFVRRFAAGRVNPFGAWGKHVTYWLNHPRLISSVRFEDLRADPARTLHPLLSSMGVQAQAEAVHRAVEDNTIDRMRQKEDAGRPKKRLVRPEIRNVSSGSVDAWKSRLTPEQSRLITHTFADSLMLAGYETR